MGDLKNPTIAYGGCDTTEEFCSGGAEMELNSVIRKTKQGPHMRPLFAICMQITKSDLGNGVFYSWLPSTVNDSSILRSSSCSLSFASS